MRVRTLEIRWHDSKPINSCDFQPVPPKKSRPANDNDFTQQAYRLATAGEDNNVRVCFVVVVCLCTTSMYLCVYVPMCVFVIRSGWSIRTCFLLAWLRERQPQISRLLTPLGLNTSLLWLNIKLQSTSLDLVQMVILYFNVFHPCIVSPSFFLPALYAIVH